MILRDEHGLRRVLGPKRDERTLGWRYLRNEELIQQLKIE
jgi:hypothetical protein